LVEDFARGINHKGLAFDRTNRKAVPFTFFHPRITKEVTEYVEMELEDGTTWRGTTDHPWLLTTGKYKKACELTKDDEIQKIPRQAEPASMKMKMRIKSVKIKRLKKPVPVYDATSPKYHNLVLANGCVVHNTAKFARDKNYQEVFYLRGKIMNALRATDAKVLESEEVKGILQSIGFDPSRADPLSKLRVGKIICLSDPDDDGYHINSLILTLLWKYLPGLFERGLVYVVKASEYVATINGKMCYSADKADLIKQNGGKAPADLLHLKGWGEASVDQLKRMAFDPEQRLLEQLTPSSDGGKRLKLIMSDDPVVRKEMLGV
jgi:DNA gyrase/topoisomerase IV subunit B